MDIPWDGCKPKVMPSLLVYWLAIVAILLCNKPPQNLVALKKIDIFFLLAHRLWVALHLCKSCQILVPAEFKVALRICTSSLVWILHLNVFLKGDARSSKFLCKSHGQVTRATSRLGKWPPAKHRAGHSLWKSNLWLDCLGLEGVTKRLGQSQRPRGTYGAYTDVKVDL